METGETEAGGGRGQADRRDSREAQAAGRERDRDAEGREEAEGMMEEGRVPQVDEAEAAVGEGGKEGGDWGKGGTRMRGRGVCCMLVVMGCVLGRVGKR